MVLFERATFLVIAHATHAAHSDVHRFEKISNIIKQFKLR
jgi:Ras-related GTP-binding protein A/B